MSSMEKEINLLLACCFFAVFLIVLIMAGIISRMDYQECKAKGQFDEETCWYYSHK